MITARFDTQTGCKVYAAAVQHDPALRDGVYLVLRSDGTRAEVLLTKAEAVQLGDGLLAAARQMP